MTIEWGMGSKYKKRIRKQTLLDDNNSEINSDIEKKLYANYNREANCYVTVFMKILRK